MLRRIANLLFCWLRSSLNGGRAQRRGYIDIRR
jgi:hypothetical protein